MNLTFPWTNINDIKFNDGEILNATTINIHLKKIYDNIYYLNNSVRLNTASTTVSGVTTLATSAEVLSGVIDNKAVTTSAFNTIISSIDQTSNYTTLSSVNMTDSILMQHGQITTSTGAATPYVAKIIYPKPFTTALFNFSLYGVTSVSTSGDYLCYRYLNNYDGTDASTLSSIQLSSGFTNPLSCAYIVYYNGSNRLSSIHWSAIGI